MATTISGLDFIGEVTSADRDILTPEACAFLAGLVDTFAVRRDALLEARAVWQAKIDAGALPDFRTSTKSVRDGDWRVGELPADLLDRRVEITGPVTRKMIINALNADVKVFMADFEDALSPTWRNVIEGQTNMRDAVSRTISFEDPGSGKSYTLDDNPAVLIARVRGLHLNEKNVLKDGKP
ncbi:Malate synthase, partial [hydrothermal vent metagenome]